MKLLSDAKRAALIKMLRPATAEEVEILERNKILRNHCQQRKIDTMQMELNTPVRHHTAITSMIPELNEQFNPDKDIRRKYWKAFIRDELSKPYRVR